MVSVPLPLLRMPLPPLPLVEAPPVACCISPPEMVNSLALMPSPPVSFSPVPVELPPMAF